MNGDMSLILNVYGKEQAAAAKPLWLYLDKDKSGRGYQDSLALIMSHYAIQKNSLPFVMNNVMRKCSCSLLRALSVTSKPKCHYH